MAYNQHSHWQRPNPRQNPVQFNRPDNYENDRSAQFQPARSRFPNDYDHPPVPRPPPGQLNPQRFQQNNRPNDQRFSQNNYPGNQYDREPSQSNDSGGFWEVFESSKEKPTSYERNEPESSRAAFDRSGSSTGFPSRTGNPMQRNNSESMRLRSEQHEGIRFFQQYLSLVFIAEKGKL